MKRSQRLQTWLADRTTLVEHPRLYRRPGVEPEKKLSPFAIVALLLFGFGAIGVGISGLFFAGLFIWAIVSTMFH